MTAITIRKLPEGLKQKLRVRAAEHGHSMEAEARDILMAALETPQPVVDVHWFDQIVEIVDRYGGFELELPPRNDWVDFDEDIFSDHP